MVYGVSGKSDGNMSFQHGTASEVAGNRKKFLQGLDISLVNSVVSANQHGADIAVVDRSHAGKGMLTFSNAPKADALVTSTKGLALFLLTADCIPLLLVDQTESVLALVHVSWKTATLGLPEKVVQSIASQFSVSAKSLTAMFGPSIHKNSYVLPLPLEQEQDSRWQPFLEKRGEGEVAIDLIGFTRKQLELAGVRKERMVFSPLDTASSSEFFSHYRSVRTSEAEGRFATVAML